MSITPRKRVINVLNHKETERIPKSVRYTPGILRIFNNKVKANIPEKFLKHDSLKAGVITNEALEEQAIITFEEYFDIEFRYVDFKPSIEINDFTPYYLDLPENTIIDEWGVAETHGQFEHYVKKKFPLSNINTLKDIKKYPWPNPMQNYRHIHLNGIVKKFHDKGYPVVGFLQTTIFEQAWFLRGFEALLIDMMMESKVTKYLLDQITEIKSKMAKRYAEADIDILRLGDDIGGQKSLLMSKDLWKKWLKPRLKEVITAARSVNPNIHIFYHSDGKIDPIIPELIEIGIDILNPVQPECMDVYKLYKEYGKDLTFWGTIGTQTTFPFSSPEEMKRVVIERINKIGKQGGLIIGPTHKLQPDVPWKNITAFFSAVNNHTL